MLECQTFEPTGRMAQFVRLLGDFQPREIETAIEALIEHLDTLTGDTDAEDGDEDRCGAGEDWIHGDLCAAADIGDRDDAEDDDDDHCIVGDDGCAAMFMPNGSLRWGSELEDSDDDDPNRPTDAGEFNYLASELAQ